MKPIRSNTQKETCSPISSNCIIWQGPDLPCISLCNGDSISDVTYKMAVEVCALKEDLGLSDIDLTCLVQVCQTTPEPTKTLSNILKLLITKVCCLSDIVNNIPDPGTPYVEPTLNLPPCLQYSNGTGGMVTELILNQYVQRIATYLCQLNDTVTTQAGQISGLDIRVTALENAPDPTPQISSCLLGTIADVDVVVEELETQFCDYKEVLGSTTDLNDAIQQQCPDLSNDVQLATGNPMNNLTNWNGSVQNVGQSLQNMWLTICDLRAAVSAILDNCCKVDCSVIEIDFDYKWTDSTTLTMYFSPKSYLPTGFYDCNTTSGNAITITDANGNTYTPNFHFRKQDPNDLTGILTDPDIIANGYELDLSSPNAVDITTQLTFSSENLCFTNGKTVCVKCFTKTVAGYVNTDCCTITSSTTNTIVYKVCIQS
jgi:hypothetical protein